MNLSKSWGKQQTKQRALVDIGPWANALMNNPFTHKKGNSLLYNLPPKSDPLVSAFTYTLMGI